MSWLRDDGGWSRFVDSITDGTHNDSEHQRAVDETRCHAPVAATPTEGSVSIVNEAIGGNRVVNPVYPNATLVPLAVDRLDRYVARAVRTDPVIWLEVQRTLGSRPHTTDAIIAWLSEYCQPLAPRAVSKSSPDNASALVSAASTGGDSGRGTTAA